MLRQKLDILLESGTICKEAFDFANGVISLLMEKGVVSSPDLADTFILHITMAAARIIKGEAVVALDESVFSQAKEEKAYPKAVLLWADIAALSPVSFDYFERQYGILHLCALLEEYE